VDEPGETIPNADPCEFSFKYKSVIAFGKVRFLQNPEEKTAILTRIVEKYDKNKIATKSVTAEKVENVEVGEITIQKMTGKTSPPP
jgi:nitroimidazol reductase NimA-like FMN-containing flavoprotein (pyridoxamine 5'-phosphate oxidase superfamily)